MKTPDILQQAVQNFQQGDQERFDKIYELSYKYLHTCVIHVVKDEDTAMDMLQETYMEISRSIQQLMSAEDFLGWAAMIANRKCFAYLKKYKNQPVPGSSLEEGEDEDFFDAFADEDAIIPEEILQDQEKQRLIREIIDNLSDMQRLCVIGYYYNEKKQEEIAQELGIPLNTVKTNLSRAKANIKEAFIEMDVKKGTRLYALAPFLLLFFGREAEACELKPMDFDLRDAGNAAGKQSALKTKLIIGAVVTGGIVAAVTVPRIWSSQGGGSAVQQAQTAEGEQPTAETQEAGLADASAVSDSELVQQTIETAQAKETQQDLDTEEVPKGYAISEEYYVYGLGSQGLIPVCGGGGKYGLVTYDNEIVVPLAYDSGCAAVNGEGQSFFEKDGVYTVFDRDGRALFQTERTVRSINDGVVFAMDGSDIDASFAYYSLDGSVIYESDEEQWDKGAAGFNEGYAVFTDSNVVRMDRNGVMDSMADLVHPENLTAQERAEEQDGDSNIVVDVVGYSFILDVPFGAVHDGYYLARSDIASSDSYGIYTLRGIDGRTAYSWDISNIFNREGLSFSDSGAGWDFAGYYDDGSYYYNNGTCMCAYINVDGKKVYYLVDLAKMEWQDYVSDGEYWSDQAYWDFDRTVLTDEALLARADEIHMNAEKYWLTRLDGLWHYIDHYGKVMASYDGATDFYHGKALVIEDGMAYAIDDHFNKIKEFGTAEQVQNYGELFAIQNRGELFGQMVSLENID